MRKKSALDFMKTIVLGTQQDGKKFTLSGDPLKQHKLITGITGQGKSKLMASMAVQLQKEGVPFALVDPHSDMCDDVLNGLSAGGFFKNEKAYDKLWYVDFSYPEKHIPFNCLSQPYPPHQVAANILEAWKRAWAGLEDGNAVQLENVLLSATLALVVNKRPLTDLTTFLSSETYRGALLENVTDSLIQEFFASRFTANRSINLSESTLRRAFLLMFNPVLRNCLGDTDNLLNFRYLMDNKISVIFDLGNLDPQTQRFLGCLITIGFEEAALSRADMDEDKRGLFTLLLDEFVSYSAQSSLALERILTLTRKFGLSLVLACQTLSQTGDIKDALQNCLSLTFKMGYDDARDIATRFLDNTKPSSTLLSLIGWGGSRLVDDGQDKSEWVQVIRDLEKQECLVHVSDTTFLLHTLNMPEINKRELARIKEVYAQKLLRPNVPVSTPLPLAASMPVGKETPQGKATRSRRIPIDE